jgi:hypothetical protein
MYTVTEHFQCDKTAQIYFGRGNKYEITNSMKHSLFSEAKISSDILEFLQFM